MRRLLAPLIVAACGVGLPVVASGSPTQAATTPAPITVQANDFRFCQSGAAVCGQQPNYTITVPAGTHVEWVYQDTACNAVVVCPGHNVTFPGLAGPTKKQNGAVLLAMTFNKPGTYHYNCSIHVQFGMTGTVVVTAARSGTKTTTGGTGAMGNTGQHHSTSGTTTRLAAKSGLPSTGFPADWALAGAGAVGLGLSLLTIAKTRQRRHVTR